MLLEDYLFSYFDDNRLVDRWESHSGQARQSASGAAGLARQAANPLLTNDRRGCAGHLLRAVLTSSGEHGALGGRADFGILRADGKVAHFVAEVRG